MADLQSAKMQVAAAKAAVARAATDVQYSGIYAPFDGTIGISLVRMGALVTANATLLNTISSDNPMAVDIAVDQAEIPRFTKLQEHPIASDSTFTLQLADNSIYTKTGSISFIDRAVDAQTGTIKARLVFDNVGNALKVGMNANVRVKNNNPSSMLMLIPAKGLTEQMGEYFVFVVNDSSKVNLHRITVGQQINDKVVVKDGLKEGDKVVVDGMQKLKEGSLVQVKQ
jgi:membrane fusion protein (multidrug efflux system)